MFTNSIQEIPHKRSNFDMTSTKKETTKISKQNNETPDSGIKGILNSILHVTE